MLQGINLVLWMAMFGAAWMRHESAEVRWIAAAGLAFAALWQHAHVRGWGRKNEPGLLKGN